MASMLRRTGYREVQLANFYGGSVIAPSTGDQTSLPAGSGVSFTSAWSGPLTATSSVSALTPLGSS